MNKASLGAVWAVSALVLASVAGIGAAQADGHQVGDSVTVNGVAHFEKRYTFVPNDICQGLKQCPQSQPYWALVLQGETAKYEIDQVFDEGESRQPESVHLDGKLVRDGSQIKVDANVEYSASDYYILGDVRNVNLIMWYEGDEEVVSYSNWSCHGDLDRDTEIKVAVWYNGMNEGTPVTHYGLRLTALQEAAAGPQSFNLATLNNVRAFADRDTVVYQGSDTFSNVELVIQDAAVNPVSDHLVADLKFQLARLPEGATKIPSSSQIQVYCSRIR